jgi:AcrR family transcriptional regulator
MSTEKTEAPSARERIVSTAGRLFYAEGYRAIGIDRVIAEADVAKATFYRHFPSKDDLIVAWIGAAEAGAATVLPPVDGPKALSDYVQAVLAIAGRAGCAGCTYQGAAGEYAPQNHVVHQAARGVKDRVLADLAARARAQGLHDAEAVAQEMFLLTEGLWAAKRMYGTDAPLQAYARAAERIIGAAA